VRPGFLSQFLLAWVLPLGLMILLWIYLGRKLANPAAACSASARAARGLRLTRIRVTFDDVAGCDEAKFELQEVIDFLRNPGRYKSSAQRFERSLARRAARDGKTLLGRAVAGEARVPFFPSAAVSLSRCSSASAPRGCVICFSRPSLRPLHRVH
jgi:cell division protease FtsH